MLEFSSYRPVAVFDCKCSFADVGSRSAGVTGPIASFSNGEIGWRRGPIEAISAFILISSFGHNCRACDCYLADIGVELSAWELEPMGWRDFCLALEWVRFRL